MRSYGRTAISHPTIARYTARVNIPRELPLDDDRLTHGAWCDRMAPGEFAVHYSSFPAGAANVPFCTVFASLTEAVNHAEKQVRECPDLRCTIYDHRGFVGPPLKDIRGAGFKDKFSLSPAFRRWAGVIPFFGGSALTIIDWRTDFALSWPAMIGTRIMAPGFGLLFMDVILTINERRKKRDSTGP
ncbi:conserved hypothetical protein [Candidatus Sulfotelmatomonas gaucii]|uniref:Uncharacterized protein n=1 Tax=Candidatus Sulfuritelmatomonas gaucii TaxID=2043161 RepID=A0A2N9L975_9BACT|nr:conserved hypothetical protein [Candidatus Sulfotelmatomonas gaucii]